MEGQTPQRRTPEEWQALEQGLIAFVNDSSKPREQRVKAQKILDSITKKGQPSAYNMNETGRGQQDRLPESRTHRVQERTEINYDGVIV